MAELLQANWVLLVVALLIGVLVAWWIFGMTRRTTITREESADDGAPARRTQALMDAPSSAASGTAREPVIPTPAAEILAGAGIAAAAGAELEVEDAENKAAPDATPAPAPTPTTDGTDDLTRIKGVGPKLAALLHSLGVTSFAQVAAWDDAEIDRVDAQLGRFEGRIRRDDWRTQAQLLAAGDMAAYEARFGKL